jgi:hypothetical protein
MSFFLPLFSFRNTIPSNLHTHTNLLSVSMNPERQPAEAPEANEEEEEMSDLSDWEL